MPGEFYAEVSYKCNEGYGFESIERGTKNARGEKHDKLYCSEERWEGIVPECLEIDIFNIDQGGISDGMDSPCSAEDEKKLNCDHTCVLIKAKEATYCKCHPGYILSEEDSRTCLGKYKKLQNTLEVR